MPLIYSIEQRKKSLEKLLHNIQKYNDEIVNALKEDFKKPEFETLLSETNYVISDIKHTLKHLKSWTKPKRVFPSLLNFPSTDFIYSEPYGKVLIIAPWNYPFHLAISPLVAAIAAGNSVVLKPSELTYKTSAVLSKIIDESFDVKHAVVVQGGQNIAENLLAKRWDYIFFTGSVAVGKIIAKIAAENLTPITLELGGKNPCIVDDTANLEIAVKRIVWGKFFNAGQTCIAPDYILIQAKEKYNFITLLKKELLTIYGENPQESEDLARIINTKNWKRLMGMIANEDVIHGGQNDELDLFIAPTIIDEPSLNSGIMKEEIFGPLLPIISYHDEKEIENFISKYEKPLALYVFSDEKSFSEKMITKYSFGGGCVNDTIVHFANKKLPFGGVGQSGIGAYHGKHGFDLFSHKKAIVKRGTWLDIPIRYAPYKNKLKKVKKLLSWL